MQELQLFIGKERVDLFKDESVSFTQSIQDIRDIDKIFADFSKTFNIPASKKNNQIFKHYYNFDIDNGFDARFRVDATLEINSLPFKKGNVRLEGVKMQNERAHTYRITFFGNTVVLKDIVGSDKISDLNLDAYKEPYSADRVEDLLFADPITEDVICPLITHTQRLFYDSTNFTAETGNLYIGAGLTGVKWNELKYALKLNRIIEQIELDYDLEFSDDFFKDPTNKVFEDLFIWMHRKSGKVQRLDTTATTFETKIVGWPTFINQGDPATSFGPPFFAGYGGMRSELTNAEADCSIDFYLMAFDVDLQCSQSIPYTVVLKKYVYPNYVEVYREDVTNGGNYSQSFIPVNCGGVGYFGEGNYSVWIEAAQAVTFDQCDWSVNYDDVNGSVTGYVQNNSTRISTPITTDVDFMFYPNQQLPNITIIDFLNGLFRMFNLTVYADGDIIKVLPLQDFYANNYETYDITEFVDITKKDVNNALPYRELDIMYKDTGTFLARKYDELANKDWGAIEYRATTEQLDGKNYKIEAPFGHMQFERLNNGNGGTLLNLQIGWSVNEDESAYLGKPLLFYPINTTSPTNYQISFVYELNEDGTMKYDKNLTYQFNGLNFPSNSVSFDPNVSKENIHFDIEINEYTRTLDFTDTLFEKYYKDYIVDTFNLKRRLLKTTAHLPIKIFTKLNLNDRLVIKNKTYFINKITSNLLTGESKLELLNVV